MLHRIISNQFPVFPRSVHEVFCGCLVGFSICYVLIVPLLLPALASLFIVVTLLVIKAALMAHEFCQVSRGSAPISTSEPPTWYLMLAGEECPASKSSTAPEDSAMSEYVEDDDEDYEVEAGTPTIVCKCNCNSGMGFWSGLGFVAIGVWIWVGASNLVHSKFRYSIQYNVGSDQVTVDQKDHDCAFLTPPMGEKWCHHEPEVSTVQTAFNASGKPIVSYDERKTWSFIDPNYPVKPSVHIAWRRVEE
jgi:hypothetical protein